MIAFISASVKDWLFFSWIGGNVYWVAEEEGWSGGGGGKKTSVSTLLSLLWEEGGEGKGARLCVIPSIRKESLLVGGDFGGIWR